MKRQIKYPINENTNISVRDFLKSKGYSRHILTQLKNTDNSVMLEALNNSINPVYLNHILQSGETLIINLEDNESSKNIVPVYYPLDIVYEDEDILIINKPSDMPIHPSINNHDNTLANAVAYYYNNQGIDYVFRCINRLDRDTSGLTMLAKNPLSGAILSDLSKNRQINKYYYAICNGKTEPFGTVNAPIARKEGSTIERIVSMEYGEYAVTHYEKIAERFYPESNSYISLLKINLETGRTHQIRVHFKHINHPLIGDFLYNPDFSLINRQALHCGYLAFMHPITGEFMEFNAKLPNDMASLFSGLTI